MTQPDGGTPALEVSDIVAGYGGGDVLQGVSLAMADGGITCVVGPNGAGKSTLLATSSGRTGPKFVQVLPANATGSVPIVNPKPTWGS
jgi:ABC-type branched-subunit amino acid transport system ATPase component